MDSRCSECAGDKNCVAPDGPEYAKIIAIGEHTGPEEDRTGIPFSGKTGKEINGHYLGCAGLRRPQIRVTNAIRCLPPGTGKLKIDRQKDLDLLQSCSEHHLYPELRSMQPQVIIPMGAFACRAIDPAIDLELHHGIPLSTPWGTSFPMYHPASGMPEPKKMLQIRTDWIRLGEYLKGILYQPVDEFEDLEDYRHLETPNDVHEVLYGQEDLDLAADTETTRAREPFCMSFSVKPGTGYVIKADDRDTLGALQSYLDVWRGLFIFHNWLFDWGVTEDMGLRFRHKRVRDTMVRAFRLGNVPQGLKALSYRELGMSMQDFDDVVAPHSTLRVLDYYREAKLEEWPKPEEQLIREKGNWKVHKPQGLNAKLKRFFTDYSKNPSKDVFNMWKKNWEDMHEMIEEKMGPWPGKCISHAPWDEVIRYSARDADSTLRLWPYLTAMRHKVRDSPQEKWRRAACA